MDFEFLPKLPKSDLDDRTFEDLVEECLLRIPRYCPEWTNYNPSDPGITIVELFAWLTDQMLLRFNQVPRRNYVAFLELLGIRLNPPKPARTDLTFYLSSERSQPLTIEGGTEVATQRQGTEEPVIFSTDSDWVIGTPEIAHLLTATEAGDRPSSSDLRDLFGEDSRPQNERNQWVLDNGRSSEVFKNFSQNSSQSQPQPPSQTSSQTPQPGNCFYIVLTPQPLTGDGGDTQSENTQSHGNEWESEGQKNAIAGNVIAIAFKGLEAATTGIDPNNPPRKWEVWNGKGWVDRDILRRESDDRTKGFSFERSADSPNPEQGVDVILHLPIELPEEDFETDYRGYWLRCVYTSPQSDAYGYDRSPQISSVSVRSIGTTVRASHCTWIKDEEFLGVSNGKPGQTFELLNKPILPRKGGECIQVRSPMFDRSRDTWQEVENFSLSHQNSLHYTIDSNRGIVQFGPLIREPKGLQQNTQQRYEQQKPFQTQLQLWNDRQSRSANLPAAELDGGIGLEGQQYGKIPEKGWEIYMVSYRTGGGEKGNVKPETLQSLMVSKPYIRSVINYKKAEYGLDEESLEQAVMKVPGWLRTSDRAVTREDFETLAKRLAGGRIARTRCLEPEPQNLGQIKVLLIPQVEQTGDLSKGMKAERFEIKNKEELESQLQERVLLGTRVKVEEPQYIKIGARVILGLENRVEREIEPLIKTIKAALYRLLNPVFGGLERKGWKFDRAVRSSDLATCCQQVTGVNYIEKVELFRIKNYSVRFNYLDWEPSTIIYLDTNEMVCSWEDENAIQNHREYAIQRLNGSILATVYI